MGNLYDYFRAADDRAVVALMTATGGDALTSEKHPQTGVIDLKGIEPVVTLGQLVAFVLDEPWRLDLVTGRPRGPGMNCSTAGVRCSRPPAGRPGRRLGAPGQVGGRGMGTQFPDMPA